MVATDTRPLIILFRVYNSIYVPHFKKARLGRAGHTFSTSQCSALSAQHWPVQSTRHNFNMHIAPIINTSVSCCNKRKTNGGSALWGDVGPRRRSLGKHRPGRCTSQALAAWLRPGPLTKSHSCSHPTFCRYRVPVFPEATGPIETRNTTVLKDFYTYKVLAMILAALTLEYQNGSMEKRI